MDVLRVHVAVFENQIAFDGLDAGRFQIVRPLIDHRGGVAVVKSSADGRIAMPDDLDIAGQRAAGIDVAANKKRGRDFEIRMQQIDRRAGREQFHVRCRRKGKVGIAFGDDLAGVDFHDLDARVGRAGGLAVDQRVEAVLERVADRQLRGHRWRRSSPHAPLLPRRFRVAWCKKDDQNERKS